jgi:hypothetical protein
LNIKPEQNYPFEQEVFAVSYFFALREIKGNVQWVARVSKIQNIIIISVRKAKFVAIFPNGGGGEGECCLPKKLLDATVLAHLVGRLVRILHFDKMNR